MNQTIVTAVARHLLTTIGGGFLMSFGITGTTLEAVIGALSTLAGVAWSLYDKRNKDQPEAKPAE